MARIEPLERHELDDLEQLLSSVETAMGFVPQSMMTMARVPAILKAFAPLAPSIMGPGEVEIGLKSLVAQISSTAAGCRYCQAHAGKGAKKLGASEEKLRAVWEYETSDLFSEAERSALRVAFKGGQVPNAVTNDDFAELKAHWNDDQASAVVAVIAMFGFLNRWNDTMATTLEPDYVAFGDAALGDVGWEVGKHA